MERLILARHGESVFSERLLLNGDIAVAGPLTARGREEAQALGRTLAEVELDLCVTSEFERARETADIALAGRDVPRLVVPELNDPRYGRYEGGALEEYRSWAGSVSSDVDAPGGGESRHAIVARYARALRELEQRSEHTVVAVCHSLPIAYALAAKDGQAPGARMPLVLHARPYELARDDVERAAAVLEGWLAAPTW